MFSVEINNNKMKILECREKAYSVISKNKKFLCSGIYGIINIRNSQYIIFIVDSRKVSTFFSSDVFEVSKVEIILLKGSPETQYIYGLRSVLENCGIYFSKTFLYKNISFDKNKKRLKKDFWFNYNPCKALKVYDRDLISFSVRCIQGYFNSMTYGSTKITLISRRCWRRCGARFFSRGVNKQGYVSNFVETEQIIQIDNKVIHAFLQIRGSIPLVWGHKVNLKYAPEIILPEKNAQFFFKSHDLLLSKYGTIYYINLINDTNYEGILYKAFNKLRNTIRLNNFNYHKLQKTLDLEENKKLSKQIDKILDEFNSKSTIKYQKGAIRINCIDCLDRTNLMQYIIAKHLVKRLFGKNFLIYNSILRLLWFYNGNMLSLQYAGTPAIKADLLRHEKYTVNGYLKDFYYSVQRYFINRLFHGQIHDAYNILTYKKYIFKDKATTKLSIQSFVMLCLVIYVYKYIIDFKIPLLKYILYFLIFFTFNFLS